jgi:hypothetical protein
MRRFQFSVADLVQLLTSLSNTSVLVVIIDLADVKLLTSLGNARATAS